MATTRIPVETGIKESSRKEIAQGLVRFLADTYTLYLKTHNFHWNVTGPMFNTLHAMFEVQYQDLWQAVDEIAERIRALDMIAPGSYKEFSNQTSISEEDGNRSAEAMIRSLTDGHYAVIRTAREVFAKAESAGDQVTLDLLTQRMRIHEKTAWMLRSLLDEKQ